MNKLEQERQETLLDLFEHDGWKIAMKELEESTDYLKEHAHWICKTNDEWQFHRGTISANEGLLAFERLTKSVSEQINQEDIDEI